MECILERVMLSYEKLGYGVSRQPKLGIVYMQCIFIPTVAYVQWYGSSAYFTNIFFRDLSFSITKPYFELGM